MADTPGYTPHVDPQFGASALNSLAPLINALTASPGTAPGQFRASQSYYDRLQGGQYNQGMDLAMRQAAQYDRIPQMDLMRGMARLAGRPWGAEQEKGASKVADDLEKFGPMLARMAPQTFDQLHGSRGSAQVMASEVFDASRFIRDPHTGRTGLAANQAGWLNNQLYGGLYGPGADVSKMNGIGAGQAGSMFKEMTQRGMLGGPDQLTGQGVDKMRDRLKNMSGAVRGMRDIFGEMGKPDAPMQEIFDGLDKLTQGGLATRSPAEVHAIVRRTQALAHLTGTSVDQMAAGTERGAAMARSVGLDRQFGVATQQSSTAFGQAWASQAGPQGFGGLNRDQATVLDQRLRTAAASSATANRMGATVKLAEAGLIPGITNQSQLQQLVAQAGSMNPRQWQQFMESKGVTSGVASNFLGSKEANQEAVLRYGLQDRVREMQGTEISKIMSNTLGGGSRATLGRLGANPKQTAQTASIIGDTIRDALVRMDPALRSDPSRTNERNTLIRNTLRAALQARGINLPDAALNEIVANAIQSLDQRVRKDPNLKQFGNMNGLISANSGNILGQGQRNMADADAAARQSAATAGVGQTPPLARTADAIMDPSTGGGFIGVIRRAAGEVRAVPEDGGFIGAMRRTLNGKAAEESPADHREGFIGSAMRRMLGRGAADVPGTIEKTDEPAAPGAGTTARGKAGGDITMTGTLTINADNTATINGTGRPGNVQSLA